MYRGAMRRASLWAVAIVAVLVAILAVPPLLEPPPAPIREPLPRKTPLVESGVSASPEPRKKAPTPRVTHDFSDRDIDQLLTDLAAALRAEDRELARAIIAALRGRIVPPPVADEDNAALPFQQAFDFIEALEISEAEKELIGKNPPLTSEEVEAARNLWGRLVPAVAILAEGARRPECRFPLKHEDGFDMELPHVGDAILAAKILRLGSLLEEPGGAERGVSTLRLAQGIRNDGVLVSTLVATAIDRISAAGIQNSSGPDLDVLIERLDPKAVRADFRRAMVMETVSTIDLLINTSPDEVARVLDVTGLDLAALLPSADLSSHVEWMQEVVQLSDRPYHEVRDRFRRMQESVEQATSITRLLAPALTNTMRAVATDESRLALMKLGSALELHRAAQGRYPDSLEALGIPIPLDPVTGLPYVYTPDGGGYLLANATTEKEEYVEWRSPAITR